MTTINYFSDAHLERAPLQYVHPACDVIVILGDGAPGFQMVDWVEQNLSVLDVPVVVVPGNHEFYYKNLHTHPAELKRRYNEIGVDFLYNESVLIKDTLFIGGTLWTNFNVFGAQSRHMRRADVLMTDYECIEGADGFITSNEILAEHNKTVEFIDAALTANQKRYQTCVVTHHAPHAKSLSIERSSKYAPFYASDLSSLIDKHQPDLWLHGHIHKPVQYFLGETLVLSNPRGRSNENPEFCVDMTIKI